jgi:hypothetical protein
LPAEKWLSVARRFRIDQTFLKREKGQVMWVDPLSACLHWSIVIASIAGEARVITNPPPDEFHESHVCGTNSGRSDHGFHGAVLPQPKLSSRMVQTEGSEENEEGFLWRSEPFVSFVSFCKKSLRALATIACL